MSPPRSTRVLVVDDHQDCRESLALVLESYGFEVILACDGLHALAEAQRHQPQIIFTDLGMPCMNGLDFAHSIRTDSSLKGSFLVAVSGWDKRQVATHPGIAAFDRHLTKPASIHAVLDAIAAAPGAPWVELDAGTHGGPHHDPEDSFKDP